MLEFLKKLLLAEYEDDFVGVLPDDRTEAQKAKDWDAEEIASSSTMVPKFRKVKKGEWANYIVRDQDGSGSCVSQAIAKGFEIMYENATGKSIQFSSTPIYQKRKNAPDGGMYIDDAFQIAIKTGTCEEKFCPSQDMNDREMDAEKLPDNFEELNDLLDAAAYLRLPADFDYVAAWVEKYKYASVHIAADRSSWSRDFPRLGSKNRGIRHAVAAVDAVELDGVQYLVIEDSWGEFGEFNGQRLLSREVFNDMFTRGAGIHVFTYEEEKKPKKFDEFKTWMQYGQRSTEISRLQDYLKSRGYFPKNVDSTGYYGPITSLAVYNFQAAYGVATPVVLNKYKGKYTHRMTLEAINDNL